jgi:hypothetical protein
VRGHLAVLQWLRAQDPPCPWNKQVCQIVARRQEGALLEWLNVN